MAIGRAAAIRSRRSEIGPVFALGYKTTLARRGRGWLAASRVRVRFGASATSQTPPPTAARHPPQKRWRVEFYSGFARSFLPHFSSWKRSISPRSERGSICPGSSNFAGRRSSASWPRLRSSSAFSRFPRRCAAVAGRRALCRRFESAVAVLGGSHPTTRRMAELGRHRRETHRGRRRRRRVDPYRTARAFRRPQQSVCDLLLRESDAGRRLFPGPTVWALTAFTILCYGSLFMWSVEVPELGSASNGGSLRLPGMLAAFATGAPVVVYFTSRVTRALAQRDEELGESRQKQARMEKLQALGTLAAGAAHEFAFPARHHRGRRQGTCPRLAARKDGRKRRRGRGTHSRRSEVAAATSCTKWPPTPVNTRAKACKG